MISISTAGLIVLLIGDLLRTVTCDCSTPLLSRAKLSASSFLSNDRSADHAHLNSAGWSAHISDFGQYLLIDLKDKYTIESISTKGRDYTSEYVQEFKIEYGNDGEDFTSYRDKNGNVKPGWTSGIGNFLQTFDIDLGSVHKLTSIHTLGRQLTNEFVAEYRLLTSNDGVHWRMYLINGIEKLFEGNSDGESVKTNYFETPIIAQYIRINPTRWGDRISMRIELYGCDYQSESLNLDGMSYVMMNLKNRLISSNEEVIRFRFRTSRPNGLILYSKGTQKDVLLLKLENNKLVLNLKLGADEETNVVKAGSLLDNDLWHDVMISRRHHDLFFTVDRVLVKYRLKSDFPRLDLNNEMLIGGIPMTLGSQVDVQNNFTGCLENLMLNSTNLVKEIKEDRNQYQSQYTQVGPIVYTCRFDQITPVTFNTYDSHIKIDGFFQPSINCSFDFRTFNEEGVLLQNKFSSPGFFLLYLSKGKLLLQVKGTDTPADPIIIDPFPTILFNDGSWHTIVIYLDKDRIHIKADDNPSETKRKFSMQSGLVYLIGGGVHGKLGFIGCMRYISVQNRFISLKSLSSDKIIRNDPKDILFDACQMTDRCNPNPCEHNGVCKQNHLDFVCDCSTTQYSGAVCRVAKNPISCEHYKIDYPGSKNARILIDIDGSGPLEPFKVECNFLNNEITQTILHHRSEHTKQVQGYNQPGSYADRLVYDAAFEQITMLVNKSYHCKQHLRYDCFNARLLNSPYLRETPFTPFTYWMSRNNQKMDYWGGSLPGTRKCACGLYGTCKDSRNWCNCDSSSLTNEWFTDEGELSEKDYLPVSEIRVGDTGQTVSSNRMAKYTVGPLVCEGDSLLNNVITFRYDDATIELPTLDMQHSADIYLQFKTTTESGVLLHSKGPNDYIKLSITSSKSMQFSFDVGNGPQDVEVQTAYRINDNNWHSVLVEKNKKEARLVIDGKFASDVKTLNGQIRPFHLTSRIVIGATIDEREGYVGCLRSLMLNGNFVDLMGMARERKLYGINTGCSGRCESNPCLNNGTCIERYSSYSCDCQWTAFKGPICADEIGVNLRSDNYIKYDFETTISTIEEHIRVGFTTIEHRGLIFGVSSYTGEYLNLVMSTSGNLRLVFDFGFERQEIIIRNENFVLGQHHDITIKRSEKGSKITIYVDNYEPIVHTFNIGAKADAQFNKLKSIYIGRNETMDSGQGFIGCISRVSFDDHFPLRRLFQENKRDNVRAYPDQDSVREDTCGIESVTHPPDYHESKPPPTGIAILISDETSFGVMFLLVLLALVLISCIVLGAFYLSGPLVSRQKGDYITNEDKGARDAYDPDMAIIGTDIIKKQEYFI